MSKFPPPGTPPLTDDEILAHPDFAGGAHAFNTRDFFEAHERWEILWRSTAGPNKELFKALVLFATGLYKVQEEHKNLRGAQMLLTDAVTSFKLLPRRLLGMKVSQLKRAAKRCLSWAEVLHAEGAGEEFPERLFPTVDSG